MRLLRRFTWPIGGQAISSARGFLLSIVVAHEASPGVFGVFSLAFTGYVVTLNICRSVLSTPLLLSQRNAEREGAVILGSALVGIVVMAASVPVLDTWFGPTNLIPLTVALGLPGLLVQDGFRFVLLGRVQPESAALNDAIFTFTCIVIFSFLSWRDSGPEAYVAGWVLSGYTSAAIALLQLRLPLSASSLRAFVRKERRRSLNLLGENMAVALNGPFTTIIVASLATFDLVAACYATSSNILGPISVLMQGLQPQLLVMVRDYRGERRRLFRHVVQAGVLLLAFTMTCAACVLWLPLDLGFALAGQSYRLGRPLLLPVAIALGLHGAIGVALACLRFHRSPQHMRNLRLIITGLSLGGLALGLWQAQMTGIIVAALATSAICTAMALMDLHMALRCGQLIEPHPLNSPNLARPKAHDRSSDAARASQSEILSCSPFEPMRRREGRANGRTR